LKSFYFPPRVPFLDDPEKQKQFRKEYIQEVTAVPEPEGLRLVGD
jgi:hypothetical protein